MQIAIELKLCRVITYTSISYTSSHSFTESRVSHPDPEYSDRSRVIHQTNQTFAYRRSTSLREKTQESKMLSRRVIIALITSDRSFGDRGLDRMTVKTKSSKTNDAGNATKMQLRLQGRSARRLLLRSTEMYSFFAFFSSFFFAEKRTVRAGLRARYSSRKIPLALLLVSLLPNNNDNNNLKSDAAVSKNYALSARS